MASGSNSDAARASSSNHGKLTASDMLVGNKVDYYSSTQQSWRPATIAQVDTETGAILLDIRKTQWLTKQDIDQKVRRRMKPGKAQLELVRSILGTDRYDEKVDDFFLGRAVSPADRGGAPEVAAEPVVFWSDIPTLASELDVYLGFCGSIIQLEAEAKRKPHLETEKGPAAEQIKAANAAILMGAQALTRTAFSLAFWATMNKGILEFGSMLPYRKDTKVRKELCSNDFEIQDQLGHGTFGRVFVVQEKRSGRRFAAKAMKKGWRSENMPIFLTEVEWLCRVDHPNVVKLFRFYDEPVEVVLVMELCTGGDLHDLVKKASRERRPFSHTLIAHLMSQLMRGVAHVHARGLVHLDIKAGNIMLTSRKTGTIAPVAGANDDVEEDSLPHLMLIDLGVAQLFKPGDFQSGFTGGTPQTLAPECWFGEATPAADVFSCGVVFFEMCTLFQDPLQISGAIHDGTRDSPIEKGKRFWSSAQGPQYKWDLFRTMPGDAMPLCKSMMRRSRRERPSALECARSSFVLSRGGAVINPLANGRAAPNAPPLGALLGEPKVAALVRRLASSHRRSCLYRSIAVYIARKWPANQLPTANRVFLALDNASAGTGSIKLDTMIAAFREVGCSRCEAASAASAIDVDADGSVQWTEFVAGSIDLGQAVFEETLQRKFRKAQTAESRGVLSPMNLARLVPGATAEDTEMVALYKQLDPSGGFNGIDFAAFRAHFVIREDDGGSPGFQPAPRR